MTIVGFWNILSREIELGERQPFQNYASEFYMANGRLLRVGIDAYQWIFELKQNGNSNFPTEEIEMNRLLMNFHARIREMIQLNVDFILVFDGDMKFEKKRWNNQQLQDDNFDRDYSNWVRHIKSGKLKKSDHVCVQKIKVLLDDLNIHYITAPGDAEIELGRLNASKLIDAVISNDGDGFAYGANVILRNFSKSFLDKPSTAISNIKKEEAYFVTPVDMETFERHGLKRDEVIFIACFAGDDYCGVSGIGIERAWKLITKKRPSGMDFVGDLKRIYVSENKEQYIKGQLPFKREQRLQLLKDYASKFMNEIKEHSQFYFGRKCNIDFALPTDFMLATHFYPLYSKLVYEFTKYETNCASLKFAADMASLPNLPQPMSIVDMDLDLKSISIYRGNDNNCFESSLVEKHYKIPWVNSNNRLSAIAWFELPQFLNLKDYSFPRLGFDPIEIFLDKKLSECYLFKAIVNMKSLNLNFTVDAHKIIEHRKNPYKSKSLTQFTQSVYKVVYKERQIFGEILKLNHWDKNFQKIIPKDAYAWLPEYVLNMHINGRMLINDYNEREKLKSLSPKKTPHSSPRKRNVHKGSTPQKTNLFSSILQHKSPFKLKNSDVLHLDVNLAKLSDSSSPKKRLLSSNSEEDFYISKKGKNALQRFNSISDKLSEPENNAPELNYSKVLSDSLFGPPGIEIDAEVTNSDRDGMEWGQKQYNLNGTIENDTFSSDTSSLLNEFWIKSQGSKHREVTLNEFEQNKNAFALFSEKEEKQDDNRPRAETIINKTLMSIPQNRMKDYFNQKDSATSTQKLIVEVFEESSLKEEQFCHNISKFDLASQSGLIDISELSDDSIMDEKFNAIQKKLGLQ